MEDNSVANETNSDMSKQCEECSDKNESNQIDTKSDVPIQQTQTKKPLNVCGN